MLPYDARNPLLHGLRRSEPFADWFADLESAARAKVTPRHRPAGAGNLSNVKSVGEGVFEYRIDFGPGYRVYFGQDGQMLVILLTGGTKKRQQRDIDAAHEYWRITSDASAGRAERRRHGTDKKF